MEFFIPKKSLKSTQEDGARHTVVQPREPRPSNEMGGLVKDTFTRFLNPGLCLSLAEKEISQMH